MNHRSSLIGLLLAAVLIFGFAGCVDEEEYSDTPQGNF